MEFYDTFIHNPHHPFIRKLLITFNYEVLSHLLSFFPEEKQINLLELGPGKGYFYQATKKWRKRISYSAFDRNDLILKSLNISSIHKGEAPDLPKFNNKFDIIFASYLIEHLKDGEEVYELIRNCKKNLSSGGLIVFLAPDALSLKMEFWNMDYTHSFPTTRRNVAMAFYDNGLNLGRIYNINGYMTLKHFYNFFIYYFFRIVFLFYSYQIVQLIFWPFFRKHIYVLDNRFYQFYCFAKVKNLMFIASRRKI
ncbi:hypothetical protein A3B48_04805 [Candidatus Gottesmanbacteria bacterium RIFCSPLOWO2_01_FULL_40_10]|nr:MAG: hypothetical protein A3B48_04805 [Candidatus Gottesmanbacteria bacterium RIFCSPLOWO2_01_FULL_40_10]